MKMRVSDSAGMVAVLVTLLMASSALEREYRSARGIPVLLPHHCGSPKGDGRPIFVRYNADHSSFVNQWFMPVESDLRSFIVKAMSYRQEQWLTFIANDELTVGEVSSILSDLKEDTPNLWITLLTRTQVGSVPLVDLVREGELCTTVARQDGKYIFQ